MSRSADLHRNGDCWGDERCPFCRAEIEGDDTYAIDHEEDA